MKVTSLKFLSLLALLILTTIIAFKSPQGFIFPISIVVYLMKDKLELFLQRFPLCLSFIGTGLILGILTEIFAIISNIGLPDNKKILLHPDPVIDILIGFFYYSLVVVTWYFLLKRYHFSKKVVFIISGLLGIMTEQAGAIFVGIFINPLLGVPMAFIIASIYGAFPTLAYLLTEKRFKTDRISPRFYHYVFAMFLVILQWALFGLFIYSSFVKIFPK